MVDTLNVWKEKLPDFNQEAIGAKYKGINKEPMDQVEAAVWDKIQELAVRFQQADRIVLGVPMWNFAYPYKLKQLIDLACQRNMLFTYDGREYGPLLKTPRAFVVYARGGTYAEDSRTPASLFDHQKEYIDFWLKFIGVKEVQTLVVEGTTWPGKEKREESIARGLQVAKEVRNIYFKVPTRRSPKPPQSPDGLTVAAGERGLKSGTYDFGLPKRRSLPCSTPFWAPSCRSSSPSCSASWQPGGATFGDRMPRS